MAKLILCQFFLFIAICILGQVEKVEGQSKRCTWFGAKTFRACKLSCKALGHDTGVCDDSDTCVCSESEYDFLADVTEWFSEKLDPQTIIARMDTKYTEYKNKFKNWALPESLKGLVPSKCKISASFCDKACKGIGRYNGVCNSDNTDCDCSDDWVTPTQYGLCASETICRLDCQANGKATGECVKSGGWDCECKSKLDSNGDSGTRQTEIINEYDSSGEVNLPSGDDTSSEAPPFNARRKRSSLWTNY